MRNLADLKCAKCGREFYGDLLAGQALFSPQLLEKNTGQVHDTYKVNWFADWLQGSYAGRTSTPVGFEVEEFRPVRKPVLLNCLDTLYGHSLLKLLNAQYYLDHQPDYDLIVLVPRIFRWMVPEGVAAIWTVDLPLKRGMEWNDWLASEIGRRIGQMDQCWLSVGYSHPRPGDYDISRFTRTRPFGDGEWNLDKNAPAITFIWRDDRLWCNSFDDRLLRILTRLSLGKPFKRALLYRQNRRIVKLAGILRRQFPGVDFAITGMGKRGGFPDWISDLRSSKIDEQVEINWCKRYSGSHVVIGVHGSNMLLPSAHSGSVVELLPAERWGNILQDILFDEADGREMMLHNRFIPCSSTHAGAAEAVISLLKLHDIQMLLMGDKHCQHNADDARLINKKWKLL